MNCDGTHALGCFWSEALGWPLVWDEDEETAIQAPDGTGPKITWSGPPLMPKVGEERFHFHVAPAPGTTVPATLEHLLALGAIRLDIGHACPVRLRWPMSTAMSSASSSRNCLLLFRPDDVSTTYGGGIHEQVLHRGDVRRVGGRRQKG